MDKKANCLKKILPVEILMIQWDSPLITLEIGSHTRGGMHNEDVHLGSNWTSILVVGAILLNVQFSEIIAAM